MERELEDYILMSDYIFLFDMDSTITRKEVLPEIAQKINRLDEMKTDRSNDERRDSFSNKFSPAS